MYEESGGFSSVLTPPRAAAAPFKVHRASRAVAALATNSGLRNALMSCIFFHRKNLVDATPVQIDNLEAPATIGEDLADFGKMAELGQSKASDRMKVAVGEPGSQAETFERIMGWHHSVDEERAVVPLDDVGLFALGFWQIAGDRLKQIGLSDDAFKASIFVDDDRKSNGSFFEHFKDLEDGHGLVHEERF